MKRKNATRSALFTSIISLLLCVSMLVGTTFAWFTDEVKSGTNVIAAGNLDVELYYSKNKDFADEKKVDGQTLLFTDKDGNEIKNWEPGVVAYTNLQVANVGTLALTYRMSLAFGNMNYVEYPDGSKYDLSDALKVAIVEGGFEGNRDAAHALVYDYDLDSFHLEGELEGDTKTETIGVVIYWEPGDDAHDNLFNMNNGKTTSDGEPLRVELGINLFATQEEYENDSFDNTYDEAADIVIRAGETVRIEDATVTESYENNGTLIIENSTMTHNGTVLLNNGSATVTDTTMEMTDGTGYITNSRGDDSVTIFENVDATSTGGGINVWNGEAIFKSGSVTTNSTSTNPRHVFYVATGGVLTIEDGEFTFSPTNLTRKGSYLVAHGAGATIYVKGGTFHKASTRTAPVQELEGGKVIITGGKFAWDPSQWVALGYKAEKGTDGYWTVAPIPAIDNAADLKDALDAGNKTIVLAAGYYEIDLYSISERDTLNIVGQGAETEIAFNNLQVRASQFKNLTISNCTIERMPNKSWGHLVFGSSTQAGGVYTISNCVFNGVGSQGIYINQNVEATFNIENCTFNGDFGGEGAITIQNNDGVNVTVNVTGCSFNVPTTSHEVYVLYAYNGWTLNADEGVKVIWKTNP